MIGLDFQVSKKRNEILIVTGNNVCRFNFIKKTIGMI